MAGGAIQILLRLLRATRASRTAHIDGVCNVPLCGSTTSINQAYSTLQLIDKRIREQSDAKWLPKNIPSAQIAVRQCQLQRDVPRSVAGGDLACSDAVSWLS